MPPLSLRRRAHDRDRWRLRRAVVIATVADGLVLVDERRGRTVHVNATAAVMLRALLDEGFDAAVTEATGRFPVAEDIARRDVTGLIADLVQRKLLRR